MKMKTQLFKILRCSKGGPEKKVQRNTSVSQETRKVLSTQPNPIPKGAGERRAKKA